MFPTLAGARRSSRCRDDNAVSSVVLGKGGVVESLTKGAIHSFDEHDQCRALERAGTRARPAAGLRFVAAPVFRPSRGRGGSQSYSSWPGVTRLRSKHASRFSRP